MMASGINIQTGEIGGAYFGGAALIGLVGLAFLLPNLAVVVRRLHDQDKPGPFIFLGLIPGVGGIIILVLMLLEGTRGPNQFGPDPKAPADAQAPAQA